jgi:molybdenum cofactor synthesis domain-containing protein
MDGYAVRASETTAAHADQPVRLRLLDRLYAGDNARIAVTPGTCVEIATGAPLPEGADAVVMVEDTRLATVDDVDTIAVMAGVREGQHVIRRASDMQRDDEVIARGTVLNASRVGALAALGLDAIDVYARPLVSILPTGNELVNPGQPLPPGHVYEVNRFTLAALVHRHGGIPRVHPPALDTLDALRRAVDAALIDADVLVLSGGSSVGERDLVLDVLRERGEVLFHGLAVKPGKPTGLARVGRTLVLAMPGNPTSCLSNAYVLLIPLLRRVGRLPAHRPQTRRLPLASAVSSPAGKHQFLPVRIDHEAAYPTFKGSGEITSLSKADGYVEIPAEVEHLEPGAIVTVVLY